MPSHIQYEINNKNDIFYTDNNESIGCFLNIECLDTIIIEKNACINLNECCYQSCVGYGEDVSDSRKAYTPPVGAGGGGYGTHGYDGNEELDCGYDEHSPPPINSFGSGGVSYGNQTLTNLYFGSKGGDGKSYIAYDEDGGLGGGIISIKTNNFINNGSIVCNGGNGCGNSGGGGSGGSIYIQVLNRFDNSNGLIQAIGGNATDYGGKGGNGRIALNIVKRLKSQKTNLGAIQPLPYII
eukprot:477811_1